MDTINLFYQKLRRKYSSQGLLGTCYSSIWYALRMSPILEREHQFKFNTNLRYRIQKIRYEAPADPWEPIYVNPKKIQLGTRPGRKLSGLGQVKGGDWDQAPNGKSFDESTIVKGLKQRFEEEREWENTIYYNKIKEDLAESESKENYDSLEEFVNIRCTFMDELFRSIKEQGYRPNFEAEHDVPDIDKRNNQTSYYHRLEPIVDIGRNGTLYFRDGKHRVTIARILEIKEIPVNVMTRHKKWQFVREKNHKAEELEELTPRLKKYFGHPDLEDVISECQ